MKIELLKRKQVKGSMRATGDRLIVDKETGQRLINLGAAVEVIDVKATKTRLIDIQTTVTRVDFGPAAFTNSTRRFA